MKKQTSWFLWHHRRNSCIVPSVSEMLKWPVYMRNAVLLNFPIYHYIKLEIYYMDESWSSMEDHHWILPVWVIRALVQSRVLTLTEAVQCPKWLRRVSAAVIWQRSYWILSKTSDADDLYFTVPIIIQELMFVVVLGLGAMLRNTKCGMINEYSYLVVKVVVRHILKAGCIHMYC